MDPGNATLLSALLMTGLLAVHDWRSGRIPNGWVLATGLLSAGVHVGGAAWLGSPTQAVAAAGSSALGVAACAAVPWLLFRLDTLGGGDVKLLAALGASLGPIWGLEAEFYAFALALLFAGARLAYEGRLIATLLGSAAALASPSLRRAFRLRAPPAALSSLRFGPAIFLGSVLAAGLHWRLR